MPTESIPWVSARSVAISAMLAGAVIIAVYASSTKRRTRASQQLIKLRECLTVSTSNLRDIKQEFLSQMNATLADRKETTLLMMPSMVDMLPNGHESGDYYALDIGGTNFRVLYTRLADGHAEIEDHQVEEFQIASELFKAHANQLFDFMAEKLSDCIGRFGNRQAPGQKHLVGFCFSFPCEQERLDRGKLIKWTKQFDNEGAVGEDPVKLLQEALHRRGLQATVKALMNDTVATLASSRYFDQDAMVGLILGTGSNACYVERTERISALPQGQHGPEMIVNIEWGNFDGGSLLKTQFDRDIDDITPNTGQQAFEKQISGLQASKKQINGMYMGEIARRAILSLAEEGSLFPTMPSKLQQAWALTTPQMSAIDGDEASDLSTTADMLQQAFQLPLEHASQRALQQVQEICHLVGQRSGRLVAAGLAALMRQMGRDGSDGPPKRTVVGVDGGIFRHYPQFREALQQGLVDLLGQQVANKVVLKEAADGSSTGAAYLAAAAVRHEGQQRNNAASPSNGDS